VHAAVQSTHTSKSPYLSAAAVLEAIAQRHEPRRRELRADQVRMVLPQLPLDGCHAPLIRRPRAVHRRAQLSARVDACQLQQRIVQPPAVYQRPDAGRNGRKAIRRSLRASRSAGEEGREGTLDCGTPSGAGAAGGQTRVRCDSTEGDRVGDDRLRKGGDHQGAAFSPCGPGCWRLCSSKGLGRCQQPSPHAALPSLELALAKFPSQ